MPLLPVLSPVEAPEEGIVLLLNPDVNWKCGLESLPAGWAWLMADAMSVAWDIELLSSWEASGMGDMMTFS